MARAEVPDIALAPAAQLIRLMEATLSGPVCRSNPWIGHQDALGGADDCSSGAATQLLGELSVVSDDELIAQVSSGSVFDVVSESHGRSTERIARSGLRHTIIVP